MNDCSSLSALYTALKIIAYSGIVLLPTLIPMALTDDHIDKTKASNNATTKLDYIAMTNVKVNFIYVFSISAWLGYSTSRFGKYSKVPLYVQIGSPPPYLLAFDCSSFLKFGY